MAAVLIISDPDVQQQAGPWDVGFFCDVGLANEVQVPPPPPPPPLLPPLPPPTPVPFALKTFDNPLDMYRFIIFEIRRQDQLNGNKFLERYLRGPNRIWDHIQESILQLPELWDTGEIPDRFLKFLKNIVGWTNEPLQKKITDAIDDAALRRLIAASGALWRLRGPEDTMLDILRIVTKGARSRIWNWFDFRWVLDETELGEEHEGRDPWVINLPSTVEAEVVIDSGVKAFSTGGITVGLNFGFFTGDVETGMLLRLTSGPLNGQSATIFSRPNAVTIILQGSGFGSSFPDSDWEIVDLTIVPDDEFRSNLRIMDDGTLDRDLVKRILVLMRAVNERIEINYLLLLDRFNVEGDDLQWDQPAGENLDVSDGRLKFNDASLDEETSAIVTGSATWSEYVFAARVRGSFSGSATYGLHFYRTDVDNTYVVSLDEAQNFTIEKLISGTPTTVSTVNLTTLGAPILEDVFYTWRVSIIVEGAANRIQVFIDGALLLNTTDAEFSQGTVGFFHTPSATIEIDECEVFELPADQETLNINVIP